MLLVLLPYVCAVCLYTEINKNPVEQLYNLKFKKKLTCPLQTNCVFPCFQVVWNYLVVKWLMTAFAPDLAKTTQPHRRGVKDKTSHQDILDIFLSDSIIGKIDFFTSPITPVITIPFDVIVFQKQPNVLMYFN